MINDARLVKAFMHYVTINSESMNEGNFIFYLEGLLKELGFEVSFDTCGHQIGSNGNNLIAFRAGEIDGTVLGLCAHADTVSPGVNIEPVIEGDLIKSKGNTILAADDKSGIAVIIESIRSAIEQNIPLGPIEVIFTISEEDGIQGSRYIKKEALRSTHMYVLDGTGDPGEILIQGPSKNKLNITVNGLAAHAGLCPEKGISAIEVTAKALSKMKLGRIDHETTANIGTIVGGRATNIVCDTVTLTGEVRSLSNDKLDRQTNHIFQTIKETCNTHKVTYEFDVDPLYKAYLFNMNDPFLSYTRKWIKNKQLPLQENASGGGSDANNFNALGIPTLNLGVGMKNCHTVNEYISINHLSDSASLLKDLLIHYWSTF